VSRRQTAALGRADAFGGVRHGELPLEALGVLRTTSERIEAWTRDGLSDPSDAPAPLHNVPAADVRVPGTGNGGLLQPQSMAGPVPLPILSPLLPDLIAEELCSSAAQLGEGRMGHLDLLSRCCARLKHSAKLRCSVSATDLHVAWLDSVQPCV